MTSLRLSAIVLLTTTAACSASNGTGVFSTGTGSGGSGGSGGASTASSATGAGDGVGGSFTTGAGGGGTGGGEPLVAEVWGQSPDTLYKLDPTNNAVTTIGKLKGRDAGVTPGETLSPRYIISFV